jgi:hypothetical protein
MAAEHTAFSRLGITDLVLLNVVTENHTLLTSGLDLYLEALHRGRLAINFMHHIDGNR